MITFLEKRKRKANTTKMPNMEIMLATAWHRGVPLPRRGCELAPSQAGFRLNEPQPWLPTRSSSTDVIEGLGLASVRAPNWKPPRCLRNRSATGDQKMHTMHLDGTGTRKLSCATGNSVTRSPGRKACRKSTHGQNHVVLFEAKLVVYFGGKPEAPEQGRGFSGVMG